MRLSPKIIGLFSCFMAMFCYTIFLTTWRIKMSRSKFLEAIHNATVIYCFENDLYIATSDEYGIEFISPKKGIMNTYHCELLEECFSGLSYGTYYVNDKDGSVDYERSEKRHAIASKRYIKEAYNYIKHGIGFNYIDYQSNMLLMGE